MARKHRRRTRKRGGSVKAKLLDGFKELQNVGKNTLRKGKELGDGINEGLGHISSGYRTATAGGPLYNNPSLQSTQPMTEPRTELDKLGNVTEVDPDQKDPIKENPLAPLQIVETNEPTKEIKGGLLGLGTWFGLGGRRLSHSSFINKMLRVRNKTKRNKAIRKYLKGGKRKTRKRKTRRRGGMNPQGGDNNLPRQAQQAQQRQQTEEERLAEVRRQVNRMQMQRIAAARKERDDRLIKEGSSGRGLGGGKRKRKKKTKKRRRRR